MTNVNLVVLHRQQYRSDNSVTTYIEPTCVEMFYNPHQSGVARKFFRKQRRHTKNNNLGPRKQGDGGAVSDAGSCISVPRSISDSGGSISEEKNVPVRFVIGQESLFRNVRKVNNNCRLHDSINRMSNSARNNCQKELLNITLHDSDIDIKTDEEKYLQSVSQQCSLEYSSEIESQIISEKSDHNLSEIYETVETVTEAKFLKKDCQSMNEFYELEERQSNVTLKWLTHSNSMHCLPIDTAKPLRNNYCNSLNDITSLTSLKKCEYLKSFTDLQNITSSNLCDKRSLSQKSFNKSELSFFKINSATKDNLIPTTTYISPEISFECASNACTDEYKSKQKLVNSMIDMRSLMHSSCNIIRNLDTKNEESLNKQQNIQNIETNKTHLNNPNTYLQIVKKETSV